MMDIVPSCCWTEVFITERAVLHLPVVSRTTILLLFENAINWSSFVVSKGGVATLAVLVEPN
jgi:heme/copper-type cytochrome/quinol oxidase subunit 1